MKIKTNKRIQHEVDKRQGHTITHLTVLHACGVEFANESGEGSENFHLGVENGIKLYEQWTKAAAKHVDPGKFGAPTVALPKDFGIYVATQETSDGDDYLYFIGSVNQIVAKLRKVEPANELGDRR